MSPRARHALPDAVLFDMDGTLVDSEGMMTEALTAVLSGAGIPIALADLAKLGLGRSWIDVHADLDISSLLGWSVEEMVQRALSCAREAGAEPRTLGGAVELIGTLADNGVVVGIVSGSLRSEVVSVADRLGIADLLAVALGAEDYPRGKPDPSGYLHAASIVGIRPRACLVFEDSEVGVISGLSAGMTVIATTEAAPPVGSPGFQDVSKAHDVVESLSEVTLERLADVFAGREDARSPSEGCREAAP